MPRVVVKPNETGNSSYLEIKKTLNKSDHYLYKHLERDYNLSEVEEVKELKIYSLLSKLFK